MVATRRSRSRDVCAGSPRLRSQPLRAWRRHAPHHTAEVILLGITGGIGMGKSTTAECLNSFGVPTIDTDLLARDLVQPGQPALAAMIEAFGSGILDGAGGLDRSKMAELVFSDASARTTLEGILHPRIRAAWKNRVFEWRTQGQPAAAVIIPLLFETEAAAEFDEIVCVACSEDSQRQRLRARGWSEEHLRRRLAAQWPVSEKIRRSSIVIWTDTPVPVHCLQVRRMLQSLGLSLPLSSWPQS